MHAWQDIWPGVGRQRKALTIGGQVEGRREEGIADAIEDQDAHANEQRGPDHLQPTCAQALNTCWALFGLIAAVSGILDLACR